MFRCLTSEMSGKVTSQVSHAGSSCFHVPRHRSVEAPPPPHPNLWHFSTKIRRRRPFCVTVRWRKMIWRIDLIWSCLTNKTSLWSLKIHEYFLTTVQLQVLEVSEVLCLYLRVKWTFIRFLLKFNFESKINVVKNLNVILKYSDTRVLRYSSTFTLTARLSLWSLS